MKRYLLFFIASILWTSSFSQRTWDLKMCIDYAIQNNIQVKQSGLNVDLAEQRYIESRAGTLPTLNGFGSHGYNWGQRIDPFTNQFASARVQTNSLSLSSSVTLFGGMQTQNNIKQSKFDLLKGRYDVEKMKNDIALNIATTYLQILFNRDMLQVAEKQVKITKLQLGRLYSLEEQGQVAKARVLDITAQLANEELNVVNAQNALDLTYLSLKQLMQLDKERAAVFRIAEPNVAEIEMVSLQQSPGQVLEQAMQVMPEVKSAEMNLESAEKGISVAMGGRSPRLSLNGSYGSGYSGASKVIVGEPIIGDPQEIGYTGTSFETVYQPTYDFDFQTKPFSDQIRDNVNKSMSFTLSIPIFNGLAINSGVKRAKIAQEMAQLNLQSTKDNLQRNIQQAFADASAAFKRFKASEKAHTAMKESFKFAEVRYIESMITTVEYSDAMNKVYGAEVDMLQAKYDYIFRTKVLEFYQGKALAF